jgi:tRNA(Ile)-lysidine synthase
LTLKKSEITDALRVSGIPWREDGSNAGRAYFRNRVRAEVLPIWAEAAQRDALAGAALTRELLEEDDAALAAWLEEVAPLDADGSLALNRLADKPRGLVRRALHRWLLAQPQAGSLARQGFDSLLAAVERGAPTRHSLGTGGYAVIRGGFLRFVSNGKPKKRFRRRAN